MLREEESLEEIIEGIILILLLKFLDPHYGDTVNNQEQVCCLEIML